MPSSALTFCLHRLFIYLPVQENGTKSTRPVSRLFLWLAAAAGARENPFHSDSPRTKPGDETSIMLSGKAQGEGRRPAIAGL